ncbi:MAG TPA: hypothetical protein DDX71_04450 [Ruminococcus sp.]|nr:hypothetical protein [Ruminococcus sp.]
MEKQITIQGEYPIGTTITYEDESRKSPAVVIIMGTGKLDRDGNGFGFRSNLYKDLAQVFADCGCVTARYDKRGTHASGGRFNSTGLSDLVNDAIAVVQYLKKLPYVDENRILICGHSEGTMIATLLAEREETAGLVLLGGAGTNLKDAMYYQNQFAAKDIPRMKGLSGAIMRKSFDLKKQLALLDEMFRKSGETTKDTIHVKGAAVPAKWLREHGAFTTEKYVDILKKYKKPVLAITGKADFQADYHKLEAFQGESHICCCAPDGLTHILRVSNGETSILKANQLYRSLVKEPLDSNLIQTIQNWLNTAF